MFVAVLVGVFSFAFSVSASTNVSFYPSTVNVTEGSTFNISVTINPNTASSYAEKIEVDYPAGVLKVKSFTFEKNWMTLQQEGYDYIDNTKGVLVKTAGYPKGINSVTKFGTITFVAKKTGKGVVKIGNESMSFDASTQSTITGNEISFEIKTRPETSGVITIDNTKVQTIATTTATSEKENISGISTDTISQINSDSQAGLAVQSGFSVNMKSWIIGIVILGIIGGAVFVNYKKEEVKNPENKSEKKEEKKK